MDRSRVFEAATFVIFICLAALLYFAIVSTPHEATGWEAESNGSIGYMFVGSDDTLYVFGGNDVTAISKDGSKLWKLDVPPEWRILSDWEMPIYASPEGGAGKSFRSYPIVGESDGNLYLFSIYGLNSSDVEMVRNSVSEKSIGTEIVYLSPDIPYISKPAEVMKITPDGKVAWRYSFLTNLSTWYIGGLVKPEYYSMEKPVAISVAGDRVYLFHDYSEDVLDTDGRLLFSLQNVSAPVAVDDLGRLYSVRAIKPSQDQINESWMSRSLPEGKIIVGWDPMKISRDLTYMLAGSTVDAYAPDGSLLWSCDIGQNATRPFLEQSVWPYFNTLPLYSNNQLYVPFEDGITAVTLDGRINWTAAIADGTFTYFPVMPMDSHGNVYMMKLDPKMLTYVVVISPDGQVFRNGEWACFAWPYYEHQFTFNPGPVPVGGKDGVVYAFVSNGVDISESAFNDILASRSFTADTIRAYEITSGRELWNFTIPEADKRVETLDMQVSNDIVESYTLVYGENWSDIVPVRPFPTGEIKMYPGKDVVYLNYYYSIEESPAIRNKSRCIYARGLYALDNSGKLLWSKQVNGTVDQVAVGNTTIYYSLGNGRIGGSSLNIAAGIAITAIAYLFLRFFMLGTVTRAKGRLVQNENRNAVFRYIVDQPGVTAADIKKDLKMNMGTLRYHLFILTLNHKIITYRDNGKFLRYFKNSGTYTEADRYILSLIRRRPHQKVLCALIDQPGLSGTELAKELDISVSAVNRHIGELTDKGVIEKLPGKDRGFGYVIRPEHRERIEEMISRV